MSAPQSLLSSDPCARPAYDGFQCGEAERGAGSGDDPAADELLALRLVKVPDWLPFDGDPVTADAPVLAAGWRSAAGGWGGKDAAGGGSGAGGWEASGTAGADRPEASSEWARQFARLLAEALAGARPVRQLMPWTSQRAHVHIRRLMPLFGGGQRPHVLRVIATRPSREVIEMTVIVAVGTRTRALAIRLEQAGLRQLAASARCTPGWVCTDIEAA